jgi:hypothetical protein
MNFLRIMGEGGFMMQEFWEWVFGSELKNMNKCTRSMNSVTLPHLYSYFRLQWGTDFHQTVQSIQQTSLEMVLFRLQTILSTWLLLDRSNRNPKEILEAAWKELEIARSTRSNSDFHVVEINLHQKDQWWLKQNLMFLFSFCWRFPFCLRGKYANFKYCKEMDFWCLKR